MITRTSPLIQPSRKSLLARLRAKGRVHAPESDMYPTLPHRDLLLKTLNREHQWKQSALEGRKPGAKQMRKEEKPMSNMVKEASLAAQSGDLNKLQELVLKASEMHDGQSKVCLRAICVRAVLAVANDGEKVDLVMNTLSPIMNSLSSADVGAVLDVLVRGKVRNGDIEGALYGEQLSRALDVGLRRGTYTMLIERSNVEKGIALLHRAVCVGATPNLKMFNVLLSSCCASGSGVHARAVMYEMGNRGMRANCDTMEALLQGAHGIESVDAVSSIVRSGGTRLCSRVGGLLMRAYLRCGDEASNRAVAVQRAMSVVEWLQKEGVVVDRSALEYLTRNCATNKETEAALRGWRELRRSWMGVGRARRALWNVTQGHALRERLLHGAKKRDVERMRRADLGAVMEVKGEGKRETADAETLKCGGEKEIAAVLGRWMMSGRDGEVENWLKGVIESERGIHVAWACALLRGGGRKWAEWFVEMLAGGQVCGERGAVLERATAELWKWMCDHRESIVEADGGKLTKEQVGLGLNKVLRVRKADEVYSG